MHLHHDSLTALWTYTIIYWLHSDCVCVFLYRSVSNLSWISIVMKYNPAWNQLQSQFILTMIDFKVTMDQLWNEMLSTLKWIIIWFILAIVGFKTDFVTKQTDFFTLSNPLIGSCQHTYQRTCTYALTPSCTPTCTSTNAQSHHHTLTSNYTVLRSAIVHWR